MLLQDLPEEPLTAWTRVVAHAKQVARVGTLRRVAGLDIAPRTPEVVRPDRLIPYRALGARLVGREAARRALDEALASGRSTRAGTVVAVVGLGGLGKTQLVVEHATGNDYPGGVYWFDADGDVDGQLGRLSERAGWTVPDAESSWKITRARERLRSVENALVVFDNVDDFARIADLVVGAPSRRTVLVSRSLQPGFPAVTLEPLDNGAATALLTDAAGRTPAHADALLAPLAGLPLAIELAGAWLRGHPAGDGVTVATDLAEAGLGAAALAGEGFTSATAHSSDLRATLRIPDHVLVSSRLRRVVDALAWSGPTRIGEELLAYMLGMAVDALRIHLDQLADARLVEVVGGRVGMHRLVAAARREAVPLGNEEAAPLVERVVEWFRARKEDWRHLDQFEAELDHLVAWRGNAASLGLAEAEVRLWWLAAYPMYHRGRSREVAETLAEAWRLYEAHRLDVPWLEAELCLDRNWALATLERVDGLEHIVRRAVVLCAEHPEIPADVRVRAQLALCDLLQASEREHEAAPSFNLAWELLAVAEDPSTLLSAPLALSLAVNFLPRGLALREGGTLLARLMRVVGERHPKVLGARSVLAWEHDRASPRREYLRELRRLYELQCEVQGPNHPNTVDFLARLGSSELGHRDPAAALKSFSEALRIQVEAFGQQSRNRRSVTLRLGLAVALYHLHRAEDARKILAPAVAANPPGSPLYDEVEKIRLEISQLPSAPRRR